MMKLNIRLESKDNTHSSFIDELTDIIEQIKSGCESGKATDEAANITGAWSIDPVQK